MLFRSLNVDVVLECTGFYTSKEKSMAHIQAGAKKVVISAPAGNDLKTIVYSVNEKTLTAEDQVISDVYKRQLENNPAIIHVGPFANIAHGCNSVMATKLSLSLADYVITR